MLTQIHLWPPSLCPPNRLSQWLLVMLQEPWRMRTNRRCRGAFRQCRGAFRRGRTDRKTEWEQLQHIVIIRLVETYQRRREGSVHRVSLCAPTYRTETVALTFSPSSISSGANPPSAVRMLSIRAGSRTGGITGPASLACVSPSSPSLPGVGASKFSGSSGWPSSPRSSAPNTR